MNFHTENKEITHDLMTLEEDQAFDDSFINEELYKTNDISISTISFQSSTQSEDSDNELSPYEDICTLLSEGYTRMDKVKKCKLKLLHYQSSELELMKIIRMFKGMQLLFESHLHFLSWLNQFHITFSHYYFSINSKLKQEGNGQQADQNAKLKSDENNKFSMLQLNKNQLYLFFLTKNRQFILKKDDAHDRNWLRILKIFLKLNRNIIKKILSYMLINYNVSQEQ